MAIDHPPGHKAVTVTLFPSCYIVSLPADGSTLPLERAVFALEVLPEQLSCVLQLLGCRCLPNASVCRRQADTSAVAAV